MRTDPRARPVTNFAAAPLRTPEMNPANYAFSAVLAPATAGWISGSVVITNPHATPRPVWAALYAYGVGVTLSQTAAVTIADGESALCVVPPALVPEGTTQVGLVCYQDPTVGTHLSLATSRRIITATPYPVAWFDGDSPGAGWLGTRNVSHSVGYSPPL